MSKITYIDIDGSAPTVQFHGRSFEDGVAQEVDDTAANQALLDAATGNTHFNVEGRPDKVQPDPEPAKVEAAEAVDTRQLMGAAPAGFTIPDEGVTDLPQDPYGEGSHAAASGKPKQVPSRYKGTPDAKLYTSGWEDWTKAHADAEPQRIPSPGQAGASE